MDSDVEMEDQVSGEVEYDGGNKVELITEDEGEREDVPSTSVTSQPSLRIRLKLPASNAVGLSNALEEADFIAFKRTPRRSAKVMFTRSLLTTAQPLSHGY
ncbi:hypothetical protein BYT27DRAFT_7186938 [Phlegmacium glaucopus]|nr:hypothetical protein BYT27DRAFT_7186938 [Phlegmacium glaucopus]